MQVAIEFTQQQLDDIWDAFGTPKQKPGTKKKVDDAAEQVMEIESDTEPGGVLIVSRKPGGKIWKKIPYVGQNREFE